MKNKRRIYIINKKFQFKYLFIILSVMLVSVFVVTFSTFYIVWNSVLNEFVMVPEVSAKLGDILVKTTEIIIIPVVILAGIFGAAGVFLSHKIAGPIYRVERVAEEIGKGNLGVTVRFRKGDDLLHLADSLNKMIGNMKNMVAREKKAAEEIFVICGKLEEDLNNEKDLRPEVRLSVEKLNALVKELKNSTDRYKI